MCGYRLTGQMGISYHLALAPALSYSLFTFRKAFLRDSYKSHQINFRIAKPELRCASCGGDFNETRQTLSKEKQTSQGGKIDKIRRKKVKVELFVSSLAFINVVMIEFWQRHFPLFAPRKASRPENSLPKLNFSLSSSSIQRMWRQMNCLLAPKSDLRDTCNIARNLSSSFHLFLLSQHVIPFKHSSRLRPRNL